MRHRAFELLIAVDAQTVHLIVFIIIIHAAAVDGRAAADDILLQRRRRDTGLEGRARREDALKRAVEQRNVLVLKEIFRVIGIVIARDIIVRIRRRTDYGVVADVQHDRRAGDAVLAELTLLFGVGGTRVLHILQTQPLRFGDVTLQRIGGDCLDAGFEGQIDRIAGL